MLTGAGVLAARAGGGTRFLIPDVLVVAAGAVPPGAAGADPADVRLVVEVVSPSWVTHDQVTKRNLYAGLGIPHYWMVEQELELRVTILKLEGRPTESRPS